MELVLSNTCFSELNDYELIAIDGGGINWSVVGAIGTLAICGAAIAAGAYVGGAAGAAAVAKAVWKPATGAIVTIGLIDLVSDF